MNQKQLPVSSAMPICAPTFARCTLTLFSRVSVFSTATSQSSREPEGEDTGNCKSWKSTSLSYLVYVTEGLTFHPLKGEQDFTHMLWVVWGALDRSVKSFSTVDRIPIRPKDEEKKQ